MNSLTSSIKVITKKITTNLPCATGKTVRNQAYLAIPTKDGIKYADNMLDAYLHATGKTIEGYKPETILDKIV